MQRANLYLMDGLVFALSFQNLLQELLNFNSHTLCNKGKIIALMSCFDYGGNPFCLQQDDQNLT
jgi:hypothetical protein